MSIFISDSSTVSYVPFKPSFLSKHLSQHSYGPNVNSLNTRASGGSDISEVDVCVNWTGDATISVNKGPNDSACLQQAAPD